MSRELSSFITSLSERDQEVKNTFKGLVLKLVHQNPESVSKMTGKQEEGRKSD